MIDKETLENASLLFKALSDSTRLTIVYQLSLSEMNVNTIARTLHMEQSTVSHQLKILKSARLVKSRREGKTRIYSISDEHVQELISQVTSHVQEKRD
ncbi:ArsR/SmtB family transcription factor [Alkalibacterium putridalgicola]|jgi:ArsR family transcriptional regulator|uniref:ArsR/SmtB family transcription factor n=1 Tax=Alkalibacterium putridalgicola TaxID=426703 RepID=UPI0034CFF98C